MARAKSTAKKPTRKAAAKKKAVAVTKAAVPEGVARRQRSERVNQQALRAVVIPIRKDLPDPSIKTEDVEKALHSTSVAEDPFVGLSHQGNIIEPPFDLLTLAMLEEQNTELTPILETMQSNIDGFGHHLVPLQMPGKVDAATKKAIREEKVMLTNFFAYANIKDSFIKLRKKRRKDYEATGNAYWEVIRSASGAVQGFEHVPAYQIRLGKMEEHPLKVEVPTLQLQVDGSHKVVDICTWTRFRKYVQSRLTIFRGISAEAGGYKTRWFKEFGDPRTYDNTSGNLIDADKVKNFDGKGHPMPEGKKANELIHWKNYSTRSPYGLPRFIGNLLSIFGARAAEEINYTTFRNHNIPSMVVLVSNGQLTDGSIGRIESFVESQIQGSDNYSKFLIIEAEGMLEGEDAGQIKMEIKPLTSNQIKDALFQNYQKNNQGNVRRAFRMPPIFVGKSDDYTKATADASRRLADEQVFAPERDEFDEDINRLLFPAMGVKYHRFKSNSPNTTDNAELVKILSGAEKTGGMTPKIARMVLEDILGMELPEFPEDERFDPDLPFSLLMAEAVKNTADPTEPGQQVTALKRLQDLGFMGQDDPFEPTVEEIIVQKLNRMRKSMEADWESKVVDAAHDAGLDLNEAPL